MDDSVWILLIAIGTIIGCGIGYIIGLIDARDERRRK